MPGDQGIPRRNRRNPADATREPDKGLTLIESVEVG